ncbi:MAG TPA: hypothetical protein VIH00_02190, partial [Candidatus Limnocylindrales bacterium]
SNGSKGATTTAGRGLYNAFDLAQPAGRPVRLPLVVTDPDGSFAASLPKSLRVTLSRPDGTTLAPLTIERHDKGLPRGYFPLQATFDVEGRWTVASELDGRRVTVDIDAKDPAKLPVVPGTGDPLPKVPTPTTTDHGGVDPICTRDPQCPFHTTSLDSLIGGSKAIALLVSTPQFCKVAICGPVLDLLVDRKAALADAGVAVIHAEVYTDDTARAVAPVLGALGLTYEPALFLAHADGTVVQRLDYIYDVTELEAGLALLS